MNEKISSYETLIMELTRTGEMFHLSATEARLLAVLYIENRSLTLDQMAKLIGKSKTAVNIAVRNLSHLELVDRVWVKGSRKDFYTNVEPLYKKLMTLQVKQWHTQTNRQFEAMEQLKRTLPENDPDWKHMQEKLSSSLQFHQEAAAILEKITATSSS
ncbi:GbsR/MarR family transcriptional regulator [Terribacillus sp. JSM ZJ617]|uniref:GbsR/MarR family transcriptional regulator n=1 Tax=Terribacillus sp. JSM ZJ617 TaxID=3342119 RepID=UPI0035A83792